MRFTYCLIAYVALTIFGGAYGSELKIISSAKSETIFPMNQSFGESHFIRNLVLPPLIAVGSDERWTCVVCESIPSFATNTLRYVGTPKEIKQKKKLKSSWRIRSEYFWNDGMPLTGYDVKFTLQRMQNRGVAALSKMRIEVDPNDPRRFSVIINDSKAHYYQLLAISLLPHRKPRFLDRIHGEKDGFKILKNSSGLYYGAYQIDYIADDHLQLVLNQSFKGRRGQFKRLKIFAASTLNEIEKLSKQQDIDLIADGTLSADNSLKLLKRENFSDWHILHSEDDRVEFLKVNLKNPYLSDRNIRRALLLGIDHDKLIANTQSNFAKKPSMPPFFPRLSDVTSVRSNTSKAKKLLAQSGWEGDEGKIKEKNNIPLKLDLVFFDQNDKAILAQEIKTQLKEIGVFIKLKPIQNPKTFYEKFLKRGLYKDLILISTKTYPDMDLSPLYHSRAIPSERNHFSGYNFGFLQNKRSNDTLDKLEYEFDFVERQKLKEDFAEMYQDFVPAIPLLIRPRVALVKSQNISLGFAGRGYHLSLKPENWARTKPKKSLF